MGQIVKVGDSATRLAELLARMEAGEAIVIARGNHPIARLLPIPERHDVRGAIADILSARTGLASTTPAEIRAWREEGRR